MNNADRLEHLAPLNLPEDLRTAMIAGAQARAAANSIAEMHAALLAALVSELHAAGSMPADAIVRLNDTWASILSSWPGAPELQAVGRLMAHAVTDELAWQLPSLGLPSTSKPTRVGKSRRPKPGATK